MPLSRPLVYLSDIRKAADTLSRKARIVVTARYFTTLAKVARHNLVPVKVLWRGKFASVY